MEVGRSKHLLEIITLGTSAHVTSFVASPDLAPRTSANTSDLEGHYQGPRSFLPTHHGGM
jgi:hypothetical protein